jgi:hypothetical protein
MSIPTSVLKAELNETVKPRIWSEPRMNRLAERSPYLALRIAMVTMVLLPCLSVGDELRAGLAKVTLPIGDGVRLAGFPTNRFASRAREPLQARVLLLKTATESVAIVSCDLHSFRSRRVAEQVRRDLGIKTILFAASGSHSAPGTETDEAQIWLPAVEDAILSGLKQAGESMFTARIGVGTGSAELAYNIRMVDENGAVKMLWRNPDRKPTGPVLNTIPVLRIDTATGEPRAIVYSAACSASVLGRNNRELSGDYPGYASRQIESILGGRTIALFLQGASGNLAPFANESSFDRAEQVGKQLAREVSRVAAAIMPTHEIEPALAVYRTNFRFHDRWDLRKPIVVESATVVINRVYALAIFPGAPFVEHQIALADRSPLEHTLVAANTLTENSEWAGILPTIRAAAEGGHGASYATSIEAGAGEAIVDSILVNIYRAIGKLDDVPRGILVVDTPPEGKPQQ